MLIHFKIALALTSILFAGCSTIDIRDVEPEKLNISVNVTQTNRSTSMDVFLTRGIFKQAVTTNNTSIEAEFSDGNVLELVKASQKGRFGIRQQNTAAVTRLTVQDTGSVDFPYMTPVIFRGREQFEGASFFKDDILNISLPSTQSDRRYLVATGYCGGQSYTAEMPISSNDIDLELPLSRLINMVNKTAEADLNGVIPMVLAVEERYFPVWQPPFNANKIVARDETQFSLDTSGFRFKASVAINVSSNVFLGFQTQPWDVKYCF